jgi:hypothetical protein
MARRGSNTRPASVNDARQFLVKATEWLEAAHDASIRGNPTATVGCSVHAAISAADAISSALLGTRWTGDHAGAAKHVDQAGKNGTARPATPGLAATQERLRIRSNAHHPNSCNKGTHRSRQSRGTRQSRPDLS